MLFFVTLCLENRLRNKKRMKKFDYTHDQLVKMIDDVYNTEKGKNFISHLIRSFLPVNKSEYLWDDPKDISKLKCCITGHPLMSKSEILGKLMNDDTLVVDLKLTAKAILASTDEEKAKANQERQENLDKKYKGKLLAICCSESDKYFAQPTFEAFQDWVCTKILSDDSHINWIMKSHRKNEALKFAKKNNIPVTPREQSALNKAVNKPATTNFEDNQALKSLLEKFNNQKNNESC